jgi:hypothetical protein
MEEAVGLLKPAEPPSLFTELRFGMLIQEQQLGIAVLSLERLMAEIIGDLKQAKQRTICGTFLSLMRTMELPLVKEAQLYEQRMEEVPGL